MQETTNYKLNKPDANDNVNINDLNENMDIIDDQLKKTDDFFKNGGEIGGPILGPVGANGHRFMEHVGVFNSRNAKVRASSANYNGYPAWNFVIEDIDNDVNSNGLIYMLGNGIAGNNYKDNYLRPWKQGYNASKNNIGSEQVSWDDIWLVGRNINTSGYTKLPNGMIMQWARQLIICSENQDNNSYVQFPIAFTTKTIGCWGSIEAEKNFSGCVYKGATPVLGNSLTHGSVYFKNGGSPQKINTIIYAIGY